MNQRQKTPVIVSGKIFSYGQLVDKLDREIDRLVKAQLRADEENALDHALNAAFTGLHLLEWEEQSINPTSPSALSGWELLNRKNDADLNLLHAIVTKTKHVTVSNALHVDEIEVRASAATVYHQRVDAEGKRNETSNTQVFIKFGDELAFQVLQRVLISFRATQFAM